MPGWPCPTLPLSSCCVVSFTEVLPPLAGRDCPLGLALHRVGSRDVLELAWVSRSVGIWMAGYESESACACGSEVCVLVCCVDVQGCVPVSECLSVVASWVTDRVSAHGSPSVSVHS